MKYFKKLLRQAVGKFNSTSRWKINRAGYSHNFFHNLLDDYFLSKKNIVFIQIGGCDGKSFDPIYPYLKRYRNRVSGVIVEPVHEYCNELRSMYSDQPGIKVFQGAIHNSKDNMPFYRPDLDHLVNMQGFEKGIASFNKHHITKYGITENEIIEETVECITLPELIEQYSLTDVDILQIDTEGYDGQIILNIDFSRFKPSIIHFEHGLGDEIMTSEELAEIIKLLNSEGYDIQIDVFDATAYERNLF
ncbi:MAG: FkbM family methyltransferase [Balneolaceae bacterium]|nr:FkbM family methyltransferase [Balneolaceae bacterium]